MLSNKIYIMQVLKLFGQFSEIMGKNVGGKKMSVL